MDRKLEKPRGYWLRKHWPWMAGAVVMAGAVLWLALGNHSATLRVPKEELTVSEVSRAEFKDYIRTSGQVMPIQVVQIAPEEGGIVMEKVVEEGASVHKGDVIVRLANANLDLQILNAEAELAEKQNMLRNTQVAMEQDRLNNLTEEAQLDMDTERKRRTKEQNERLYGERLISQEDYVQSREDWELAERKRRLVSQRLRQDSIYRSVQMDQMEDNLANMRRNVVLVRQRKEKLEVRATIDGELGLLDVELGQSIQPGMKIGQINDLRDFKVQALVDEHYIERLRQGLRATTEREGQRYALRVRKVYPEVREGKFRVDFVFEPVGKATGTTAGKATGTTTGTAAGKATDTATGTKAGARPEQLRSGQTLYLNVELGQSEEAVLVPRGTFFQTTGGQWIFVLSKDGHNAYRRNIRIGRQNPRYYEVLEGLAEGERVITSGYEAYKDYEVLEIK